MDRPHDAGTRVVRNYRRWCSDRRGARPHGLAEYHEERDGLTRISRRGLRVAAGVTPPGPQRVSSVVPERAYNRGPDASQGSRAAE